MRRFARHLLRVLVVVEFLLMLSIARDAAYITTKRLYIGERLDDATQSTAVQRFDIEGSRVVPQIAARTSDHIAFPSPLRWPSRLHVSARPTGPVAYQILWRHGSRREVLATGDATTPRFVSVRVPAEPGVLEFVNRGSLTWIDPRLVTELRIAGRTAALAILGALSIASWRWGPRPVAFDATSRLMWFRRAAAAAALTLAIGSLEIGLRALGDRLPSAITAQRHDLGEVRRDPRWQDTRRYGRRLRPRVDGISEWRYGDIVRMGFIPESVSDGVLHRFVFQTDVEGFRNARTRDRIDVAALGDSFTDAMTLKADDSWTSVLERRAGLAVQNYGTAGFGPQQELRVLIDYALQHRPRVVVLAYFAGNDLFDAEGFDDYERSGGTMRRVVPGWQIRDVVSRADTWFLVSALHAAGGWASAHQRAEAQTIAPKVLLQPFDRGMFTLAVRGRALRCAFMPAYLNTLNFSEHDLAKRKGWALTQQAILAMRDASHGIGAELVVMFLPFKSQIYLPLLDESMRREELSRALRFYLDDGPRPPDVTAMLRNRLAQNDLLRGLCSDAGIRFLDTTAALEARVRSGDNVYFPDESHLNETGHATVADALASFLAHQPL